MTPDEQKQQLDATIRRKLQTPSTTIATSVHVASASSRRDSSLDRAKTKIQ
jgi:hypothetical protein